VSMWPVFWQVLNSALSITVGLIVTYKLYCWPDNFTRVERIGLGLVGASAVMTIGPILDKAGVTPYSDWATALFRVGITIYFVGRALRFRRHYRRNMEAAAEAETYLQARGKL
jgi:hypothetical protein